MQRFHTFSNEITSPDSVHYVEQPRRCWVTIWSNTLCCNWFMWSVMWQQGNTWSSLDVMGGEKKKPSGIVTDTSSRSHTPSELCERIAHRVLGVSACRPDCKCWESPNMPDTITVQGSAPCWCHDPQLQERWRASVSPRLRAVTGEARITLAFRSRVGTKRETRFSGMNFYHHVAQLRSKGKCGMVLGCGRAAPHNKGLDLRLC